MDEKQIEEMAKVIDEQTDRCQADTYCEKCSFENNIKNVGCCSASAATALYNAGYRKTFASSLATNEQVAYKEGYNKGIAEMTQAVENANDELERQWLTSISLEAHNHEINELKAENERIRQNSVSPETFKAIMDEKQERESEYKTRKIVELTIDNQTLKDRISALEIDQSQFEELEKQLAIYKRALRTACLVKGSCRSCWEKHDKRCNGMCNGDVKVCIEHFIQRAERELEEQDNA